MMRFGFLAFGCMIAAVWAQESAPQQTRGGVQVRSVAAYFDYYSAGLPATGGAQYTGKLLPDADGGASIQVGWTKPTERSSSSLNYTSSYTGRIRYTDWNTWNHALSFATSYKLVPRLSFGFSASGDVSSIQQSLFSPTSLSNAVSVPASFDDLSSAFLTSRVSNPQLAWALAGASLAESPVRNLIYGDRVLTSGVQTSLSYSYSPRLSVAIHAGGSRMQALATNQPDTRDRSLILNTTSGNAGVSFSYSLSPHAQLGGSVNTTRIASSQQDAYTTTSLLNLGWTISRRWLIQIHGGAGVVTPVRQLGARQTSTPRPSAGGSLGYKTFSHTFLGSFDRTVTDQYGLGSSTSSSAGASWRWNRPGRHWWVESGLTWQRLYGNGFSDTTGWRATTGFGQRMGRHFAVLTQYAYIDYSGLQQAFSYALSQSAIRVSVVWFPSPELSR